MNNSATGETKYLKTKEWILYLMGVFFYTMMTGMVGGNRNAYLVNVLGLPEDVNAFCSAVTSVVCFVLNFFIVMYIDGRKMGKKGKFRPIVTLIAIPMFIILMLNFIAPQGIAGTTLIIYVLTISISWGLMCTFGNSINMIANVMTPNMKERDQLLSFRSIASAVGNSAPLVVLLVVGAIWKNNEGLQYIISAAICGVAGVITVLLGMNVVRERIPYTAEKKNPLEGFKEIIKNKYAWTIIVSEFLKSFRGISTYMETFLAIAVLGSASKKIIFVLPVGIGTAVGMLVINFLLKKFNARVLYIASGIYSVTANCIAFTVGYFYFKNPNPVLMVVFVAFLFLIGIQFGASNLLPSMFQADVLEDIELKTGKRLDASMPFVISIGTLISGTIASTLAPLVLYGDNSIIHYVPSVEGSNIVPEQTFETKILLLFFYTIIHGIMMFLAGVPFFFYKLTGKTKEDIHNKVVEMRKNNSTSELALEGENEAN